MKRQNSTVLFFFLFLSVSAVAQEKYNYVVIYKNDTQKDVIRKAANVVPAERQLKWQQMELITSIHFGMNTFTGNEWGKGKEAPDLFNPKNLYVEQWVEIVKDAGFKQLILTCKHHNGFCLWPSKTTGHSVKSCSWKDDNDEVVKEVAETCRKYGIAFGGYFSHWSRNALCYGTDEYNDFFVEEPAKLLTQYGEVSEIWFDGACGEGLNIKKLVYDFMRWYKIIRELQLQDVIAVMNDVILLNLPPDTNGLINKNDIQSLEGFKQLRDETFNKDLEEGACVTCTNGNYVKAILDKDYY